MRRSTIAFSLVFALAALIPLAGCNSTTATSGSNAGPTSDSKLLGTWKPLQGSSVDRLVLGPDGTGYFIVDDSGKRELQEFIWGPDTTGGAILKVRRIWDLKGDTKVIPAKGKPSPEDRAAAALAKGTVWSQLEYQPQNGQLIASAIGAKRLITSRRFARAP